ncbi:site-specific integrase [bacterium]|nr:site-specific integrase [bacterium]
MTNIVGVRVREKVPGSGKFWVFVSQGYDRTSFPVGEKEAAEREAENIRRELRHGIFDFDKKKRSSSPTVKEYYSRFMSNHVEGFIRKSYQKSIEGSFENHIIPHLGSIRLNKINRHRIKAFVSALLKKKTLAKKKDDKKKETDQPLSKDSIRIILAALSKFLNAAIEDQIIQANPAAKLGKFYKQAKKRREEIHPLTQTQVLLMLEATIKHFPEHYPLLLCAVHSGLRAGELAALQRGDLDFVENYIMVRRSFSHSRMDSTKNSKKRRVDMSDALAACLKDLPSSEYLFGGEKPLDMRYFVRWRFEKILELAKISRIRFHDLRHTFASILIANNESLAYVKEQLGHSSIRVTVDIYGHLVPGANRQAVNKIPSIAISEPLKVIK